MARHADAVAVAAVHAGGADLGGVDLGELLCGRVKPTPYAEEFRTFCLEGRSVALVGPLFKNYGILLDALEREGVRIADLTTLSEMTWLHQFAKSGSGVAFTARSVLPLYEDDPSVVALLFRDMPYEVGVSWLATHRLSEAEEAFVEACRARRDELAAEAARGGRRPGMGGLVGDLVRRFAGGRGSAR